jgi:uncharacterized DUF497 family protein
VLIEVDPVKDAANIRKHGISLGCFTEMDFDATLSGIDARHSTGTETRWVFVGPIAGRLWIAVVTYRGSVTRVISLRPASRKERRMYGDRT